MAANSTQGSLAWSRKFNPMQTILLGRTRMRRNTRELVVVPIDSLKPRAGQS
jgi:hypothetical protein